MQLTGELCQGLLPAEVHFCISKIFFGSLYLTIPIIKIRRILNLGQFALFGGLLRHKLPPRLKAQDF
uniref:Uncharacterized protein n=1 Tax=Rhizophora mucronata TaxID=61149 RepID=A0A2P2LJR2_RHIMU